MTGFIASACRSPVAPRGGALSALALHELAAPVINAALREAGLTPQDVDEVILSNALGGGGNPARIAALAAGLPEQVVVQKAIPVAPCGCGPLRMAVHLNPMIRRPSPLGRTATPTWQLQRRNWPDLMASAGRPKTTGPWPAMPRRWRDRRDHLK